MTIPLRPKPLRPVAGRSNLRTKYEDQDSLKHRFNQINTDGFEVQHVSCGKPLGKVNEFTLKKLVAIGWLYRKYDLVEGLTG
jgi:hypothetical protein